MIDYHIHSDNSGDATGGVMTICRTAVDRGFTEICFTEHVDFEPADCCYGTFDYARYASEIESAREVFDGRLTVSLGVEVDYQDKFRPQIRDFLDGKRFDYVLGAAHYVDGIILEDHWRYFPGKTAEEAYSPYFDNTLGVVETGWFDALAHLDVCKRYGVGYFGAFDRGPHRERVDEILRAIVKQDMTLEVNASGLRQSPNDTYPGEDIVAQYYALGGRNITVGSDAHRVKDVGWGAAAALDVVRDAGFESVDTYHGRRRFRRGIAEIVESRVGSNG